MYRILFFFIIISFPFCDIYSQVTKRDSFRVRFPIRENKYSSQDTFTSKFDVLPSNIKSVIEYDPVSKSFILKEQIGNTLYRPPYYVHQKEYSRFYEQSQQRHFWRQIVDTLSYKREQERLIPLLQVNSPGFVRTFGSSIVDFRPQGFAEVGIGMKLNKNANPIFTERQRNQLNFDFTQRMQVNLAGQVGDRLRVISNYNTDAQFDFENQVKIDYKGGEDDILQSLEAGNVSLPLNLSLIQGSQALFGIKTRLKFGKLDVTTVVSQQRSQYKEIVLSNGGQKNSFRFTADGYDGNRHFFLAQFFRNQYNAALKSYPLIQSAINITKIEIWVTNRGNSSANTRDVLGLMDLGEYSPYDLRQKNQGGSVLPASGPPNDPAFPQQSNQLVQNLFSYSPNIRNTNSNDIVQYFQGAGGVENYSRITLARKLTSSEFILNPRLGYISLSSPLNADEALAVSYRYTYNGQEYQVGEFSNDVNVDTSNPSMLFAKLLKNEILNTSLPSWDLMMKNIYTIGSSQISSNNFQFNIYRLDEQTGVELPSLNEGTSTRGRRWLELLGLDRLDRNGGLSPDGTFDFQSGITVDPQFGRIIFPTVEPFGKDLSVLFQSGEDPLRAKYVFNELYRLTSMDARIYHARLNRYIFKGSYISESGSEFLLNATNLAKGSVQVMVGAMPLSEGKDFTVDYESGRLNILNPSLLRSDQQIKVRLESNALFGLQQRSLFGTHLDYQVNDKFQLGATFMNLNEKPLTAKINLGQEPVSNTVWGLNANYTTEVPWITRMLNKLPLVNTKEPSVISVAGEYAQLLPGHPRALDFGGSRGVSYIDDFEGTRSIIDLKGAIGWSLAGTPLTSSRLFPEAELHNDLQYGFNRARLAFYNIDPSFYNRNSIQVNPIRLSKDELSNHYVREILEQEVFPLKQSNAGQALYLSTLDLAFYPTIRGPYNYTVSGINSDDQLSNPKSRWGGIMRKMDAPDFEAQNVAYIEFWMMDPFIYKKNAEGGDLYFNLGSISEDILKDGRRSLENGLATDGSDAGTDKTVWGRVPRLQSLIQAFDNNPVARKNQDVGLDGLNDAAEAVHFSNFLTSVTSSLNTQASVAITTDPSSDNFRYFRGGEMDLHNYGILKRYEKYNGTEGNSRTPEQAKQEFGVENSANSLLPDGEDVNKDNTMSVTDAFYEYKVSIKPADLQVGRNFVNDKITSSVKLANGTTQDVTWFQIRIPLGAYHGKVGNIDNFKSIRFMRMFMTGFADTTILRMGQIQLVRGEWRLFNPENNPNDILVDPSIGTQSPDNSLLEIGTVNIDENGKRAPIPYVLPPGIQRELDQANVNSAVPLNEQSLSLQVRDLRDGYARSVFKTGYNDFRSYKNLEMFIHAEGDRLQDKDVAAIIRLGTDNNENYYEYEIPLKITSPGSVDPYQIWPDQNKLLLQLSRLQDAKLARNAAAWPENKPFVYADGDNKIYVKGQPDLSKVRVYMLGVRNPKQGSSSIADDGLEKTALLWFNEMRLTGFDERGGWAANVRLNAKLADIGDISIAGARSTAGFGNIDQTVSERSRSDDRYLDFSSGLELGRFLSREGNFRMPFYFNYASQRSIPLFDPRNPDMELSRMLAGMTMSQRDSIHRIVDDYTQRRGFNFNNVRRLRTDPDGPMRLWDLENFSLSYAFSEYNHRDYINEQAVQKTYRGNLNYSFMGKPKTVAPFARLIKTDALGLLRDFNINLVPSMISIRVELDRLYGENTLRQSVSVLDAYRSTYSKSFRMARIYGLNWNLTKSLQLDFNATNYSVIDEPQGKGNSSDSLWNSLKRLGRTTDYSHQLNINYTTPINKIPGMSWTSLTMRYGVNFNWITQSLALIQHPNVNLGNAIQNSRTIQLTPMLNFAALYARWRINPRDANVGLRFLTLLKNITGVYSSTMGIYLPGYLPSPKLFGMDFNAHAPGLGFVFGSQQDIRSKAVERGWLTKDTLQNNPYYTTNRKDLNFRAILEPLRSLRIELITQKSHSVNFSTIFRFDPATGKFQEMSPITTGDYNISFFSLRTAFSGGDDLFKRFQTNRIKVSQRLGAINPNSRLGANGYAEGYDSQSQDVLVASFIAAYTGTSPDKVSFKPFQRIPIPNWRINYNGNINNGFLSELFSSININHAYKSTYSILGYNTLIRYRENSGGVSIKDANGNFLPKYQFSELTLVEQFLPLLGLDLRMRNNMGVNIEFRKSRAISLSLTNSQLAQHDDSGIIFGMNYRSTNMRLPFGLMADRSTTNDVNFKVDFTMDDRKMVVYRPDALAAEVIDGARIYGLRPSVDWLVNQKVNVRLYYDSSINNPYTSQAFNTNFTNFGINLRYILQ